MSTVADAGASKKGLEINKALKELVENVRCKPLFNTLVSVWGNKFEGTYVITPTTPQALVAQYMMTLLGESILVDDNTGEVKSCPGSNTSEEQQFEDWAMVLLKRAESKDGTKPATATAGAGEETDGKKAEAAGGDDVSASPKKSEEPQVPTPLRAASDHATTTSTVPKDTDTEEEKQSLIRVEEQLGAKQPRSLHMDLRVAWS